MPIRLERRDHIGLCRMRARTKRVMASEYRTRIKRNLKKCAASCARPAIQYVLQKDQWRARTGEYGTLRT